jgi:hypothetical protein
MKGNKKKIYPHENSKYRLFFSLYSTGGYLLLCWIYSYFGLPIYEKLIQESPKYWGLGSGRIPPYPFGFFILIFGIPLFCLIYWRIKIINLIGITVDSASRPFYVFFVFMMMIGISLVNYGFNLYFIFEGLVYGILLGLMDCIHAYKEDFSFLTGLPLPRPESKLARLQMMHERWSNGLIAIIATIIGLSIAVGVQGIIATPQSIRSENTLIIAIIDGYLCVGIILGIMWDIFNKMKQIEEKSLKIE